MDPTIERLLKPEVLPFMVAIVGILVFGIIRVTRMIIDHRERVAWIERGIDPDQRGVSAAQRAAVAQRSV